MTARRNLCPGWVALTGGNGQPVHVKGAEITAVVGTGGGDDNPGAQVMTAAHIHNVAESPRQVFQAIREARG